jgi:hypothetical protein
MDSSQQCRRHSILSVHLKVHYDYNCNCAP